jgi:hypothetical protein
LAAGYFFIKFKGTSSFKFKKIVFSGLRQKNVAYPFPWDSHCKLQIAESQSSDSGNRLAANLSIAGISIPVQIKEIRSGMPISAISQSGRPIAAKNQRSSF